MNCRYNLYQKKEVSAGAETNADAPSEPLLALSSGGESEVVENAPLMIEAAKSDGEMPVKVEPVSKTDEPTRKNKARATIDADKDYYATLGVDKDADEAAIKSAYRDLAKKYHPDVNNGDKAAAAKFMEANEAYSVLIDPQKRQVYDQKRAQADKPNSDKKSIVENPSAKPKDVSDKNSDNTDKNAK